MAGRVTPQSAGTHRGRVQRSAARGRSRGPATPVASSIHRLPHAPGNRALHRLLNPLPIQPKLTISRPDDQYEREADRVADEVMRMPDTGGPSTVQRSAVAVQRACASCEDEVHRQVDHDNQPEADDEPDVVQPSALNSQSGTQVLRSTLQVRRTCAECKKRHDESLVRRKVHRQEADEPDDELVQPSVLQAKPAAPGPASELEANIQAQKGGGRPLPESTRTSFEHRFGTDFSGVRVHSDSHSAALAQSINAKAFTVGQDITFGHGQYAPESQDGQHLLAHELTHVVQQGGTRSLPAVMTKRDSGTSAKARRIDPKSARLVMGWIIQIITKQDANATHPAKWTGSPLFDKYRTLLTLWHELTYGDSVTGSPLRGEAFIGKYKRAREETAPIVDVAYWTGGGLFQRLIIDKFMPKRLELDNKADSEKRILEHAGTTVSFWYYHSPEPAPMDEFLRVATSQPSRAVTLQRGHGIRVGVAKAGHTYYASKYDARLVLWAGPSGVFFVRGEELYKQSLAGFSDDIILGSIIKAAQDVGPFVALVTAIVDIAISLTPVGAVYDVAMAAKAAVEGRWKDAAIELLPGAGLAAVAKVGKATKVGRAAFRVGAKGMQAVGNAFSGAKTFVARGFRGKAKRGVWLVEGPGEAAGKKGYYFMEEGENIWHPVSPDEAELFIRCSKCDITKAGKGEAPPAPKADMPPPPPAGPKGAGRAEVEVEDLERIYADLLKDNAALRKELIKVRHMRLTGAKNARRAAAALEEKLARFARSASRQYLKNLIARFPKLRKANLRPRRRPAGEAGAFEESILTGSGRESWVAELRDGGKIELDDIDPKGIVVDTKMRDLGVGKELPETRTADVVEEISGPRRTWEYAKFPEKEQKKLVNQLRFAEENGLAGVRWETNSAEMYEDVQRYAKNVLSEAEQKRFTIVLVER